MHVWNMFVTHTRTIAVMFSRQQVKYRLLKHNNLFFLKHDQVEIAKIIDRLISLLNISMQQVPQMI